MKSREEKEQEHKRKSVEIRGFCEDCLFIRQEWTIMIKSQALYLDTYCFLCDVFKRPDGYCDFWEHK